MNITKKPREEEAPEGLKALEALKRTFSNCFTTAAGKKALEHLENLYHIKTSTFDETPHGTAYREGQRTVVLYIKDMMDLTKIKKMRQLAKEQPKE